MITRYQRWIFRLTLGLALTVAAVPAQASVILDTGAILFEPDGTQFGRLTRNGVPSDWSAPKDFPGVTGAPTARNYQLFTIDSDVFPFLQIILDDPTVQLFASAYLGSFNPVNIGPNYGLDTNYLGDAGFSQVLGNPTFFQIVVPLHTQIVIAIAEVNPGAGAGSPFSLIVEGYLDTDFNDIPDYHPPQVPEPATSVLLGSGLALSALLRKARRVRSR